MRLFTRLKAVSRSRSRPRDSFLSALSTMNTVTVDDKGTSLAFLDSGVPAQSASYVTIIAVHGMGFTYAIFKKIMTLAYNSNVRLIAVVRRGYEGSTPFSDAEIAAATGGTDDEKAAFVDARGVELACFVDKVIQQLDLCPISGDGKNGGVALLGWSAGNTWTLATIANIHKLSSESQGRFAAYIRTHIMEEPPSLCLGLPLPPKLWSPLVDTTLPEDLRTPFYMNWITSYFDHGDLSSRNIEVISYYVPSVCRAPSIYNMTAEEIKEMVVEGPLGLELMIMFATQPQSNAIYRKACFNQAVKDLVPKMKTSVLTGGATCSFPLNAMFSIQSDNDNNAGNLHFEIIPGVNHFMHWDDPEKTYNAYMEAIML